MVEGSAQSQATSAQQPLPRTPDDGSEAREGEDLGLPIQIGPSRLAAQFNTLLPSAHLTLVSVLQGVALAVIVSQLDKAAPTRLPNELIYIDSVLVIALAWFQYVWAFLAFLWPMNALHTTLQFFFAAAEVYAFSHIDQPRQWLIGLAAVSLIGAIIRVLNTRIHGRATYTPGRMREEIHTEDRIAERIGGAWFAGIGVALLLAALIGPPTRTKFTLVGSGVLLLAAFLLYAYHRQTNQAFARVLADSPWRVSGWGVLVSARELAETGETATDPAYSISSVLVGGRVAPPAPPDGPPAPDNAGGGATSEHADA
jgi:hypothetical protein